MTEVFGYSMDRLKAYYSDRGIGADVIEAVQSGRPTRPLDFDRRIHAVQRFRELPEAESLTITNKRIRNILRQFDGEIPTPVDDRLLRDAAEQELYRQLTFFRSAVEPLFDQGDYEQGLLMLAGLRAAVDRFFNEVLVMTEESNLKSNRIALLNHLSQLFMRTADLSRLQN
jgi:glycyl-tRNA synthetase beta chain